MTRRASPARLGLGKKLLFSAVVTVFFVLLAELLVRGWVYYLREDYERYDADTGTFRLVPGVHRSLGHSVVVNSEGFVGKELEAVGPDLWRIAAVGDSNTFGAGDDVGTYPAKLETVLDASAPPDRRYEVVNAGIEGLDSTLALRRLESKVLPLDPDVVLIYVGWNDLMKFDPLGQGEFNRWSWLSRELDRLWLVKGIRKLFFFYLRSYADPPATGPESHSGRFEDFTPSFYVDNLKTMIRRVRESGAEPVLFTLATSVEEDMTVDEVRARGIYFPYYPSAYAVGDLLDLVEGYNRVIRRVAAEEQVPLYRLDEVLGGPDRKRTLFYDTMHPTDAGHDRIAETLAEFLERHGLLDDGHPGAASSTEAADHG